MYCIRKVTAALLWIGGNDRQSPRFESDHPVPRGMSYNSYLLLDEKPVLYDTVDRVVPVPLHWRKRLRRGYNQAEVFAEKLAEEMGLPMNARLIRRVKKTKRQKELGPAERRKNLEGAFAFAKPGQMKYCRILLVDDIYTTGSTVDAIASLLKVNGAEQVDFVCAAIVK